MNYKQLDDKKKAQIDILLESGNSMRSVGKIMKISHSTISRYKNNVYTKRKINLQKKYPEFLEYLYKHYDWRIRSIEVCIAQFKKYNFKRPCVSPQQVYNWINEGKIDITPNKMCYKRRKRKKASNGMMNHMRWNIENRYVLPIILRPKRIEKRDELGHLEIDSIIGKRNEYPSILSIVDRSSRKMWLIKAAGKNEYYTASIICKYIKENNIIVKSITTDNGVEFKAMGIAAKRLGVKQYRCDPYCSFQRGTNERANALVRRYIPKGQSLYDYDQQYLEDISFKINAMPRKIFDFKSAFQVESIILESGAVEI